MIPRYSLPEVARIWSDEYRFELWKEIEVLYCEGMAHYGLIPKKAAKEIRANARFDIRRIEKLEATLRHDVVAFLTNLSENIGPSGKFLHKGMTSSDLLDTALACQLRDSGKVILSKLKRLRTVLRRQALRYKKTPMIGRTHGIHAEPTTFGLKLLVWYEEIVRSIERMKKAIDTISYGKVTGAVGTSTHIDPRVERFVMKRLGLKVEPVTTQIIQRDKHAEFITTLAVIGACIEQMALEIRGLQRTDIGEVEEPFTKGQKGSSAMPHKRNPILSERLCGMARVLRGNAIAALENVALWHERDISHSSVERIIFPDSTMLLAYMLEKFTWIMENIRVNKKRMLDNIDKTGGLVFSQHLLLYLVDKGFTREEAYSIVQGSAMESFDSGRSFKELILSHKSIRDCCSKEEIEALFSLDNHLKRVDYIFRKVLGRSG